MNFPLPLGHWFGVLADVQSHTGRESAADEFNLRQWQLCYMLSWDRDLPVTGRFDGDSQRACVAVQKSWGYAVTGCLDADTWRATFEGPRATEAAAEPVRVEEDQPALKAPQNPLQGVLETREKRMGRLRGKAQDSKAKSILWRHRHKGACPDWFDPLTDASQDAVQTAKIRNLLGLPPTGKWTASVEKRIKGLQKLAGLDPTGAVDAPTAWLLDDLPAKPVVSDESEPTPTGASEEWDGSGS
jgi:hypothetical protein